MPALRRFSACWLLALPLVWSVAFIRVSLAQGQAGKPPVSMLTKEQKAELDRLNKQAIEAGHQGEFKTAETLFLQGLEKAEALKDAVAMATFLNNLGNVYRSLGQDEKALEHYTRALAIREKIGNPADIASIVHNLGLVCLDLSQNEKALDYYTRALALYEKVGSPADIAKSLLDLGNAYYTLGHNEKALDYYTRALIPAEKSDNPAVIAYTLDNLGSVYWTLGQNEKALDYFTRAFALLEKSGNLADIANSLLDLGSVYYSLGQNVKALEYFTRALPLFEKSGHPVRTATSLNNLGNVYWTLGQNEKALEYFTRALALYKKIGSPAGIAETFDNLGSVYWTLGQNEKALGYYTRALILKEKVGNSADIASSLDHLGESYSEMGKYEEAEKEFAESKRLRESLSLQVSDPSQVGALQETFGHFYERYARLRLKRNLPEEALEMLEAGRGQGLARQIDLSQRGDITRYFTAEEGKTLQEKTQRLRDALVLQRRIEKQAETATADRRKAMQKQTESTKEGMQTAEREYEQFRDALFARYPQLRKIAYNQPAEFSYLKTLAAKRPDTLYLEWGVVDDKTTLLFALGSKDMLKPLTLATGEKALREVAQKWREALEISGGRGVLADRPKEQERAATDEVALAKQAYDLLLGEAEKAGLLAEGRYKRLVIVGSGPMLEMPLAALCDGQGRRLIERFALSHAFSLSSLLYHENSEPPAFHSVLAVADPTGEKEPDAPAPAGKARGIEKSAFRGGFLPLPGAREEGREVAEQFPGAKLLIGPQASEAVVTQQMQGYQLLHFATHGYVLPNAVMSSGLVLAEEPEGAGSYDGLLTARKIVGLPALWKRPLAAQLVVLSACETGQGRLSGGEGLMGLAWAFRAAGCPSLVVSQWAVNDAATKEWMLAFYKALKAGKSQDVAVQIAMLAVKQAHPSPFYWAAFELIGETTPIEPMKSVREWKFSFYSRFGGCSR